MLKRKDRQESDNDDECRKRINVPNSERELRKKQTVETILEQLFSDNQALLSYLMTEKIPESISIWPMRILLEKQARNLFSKVKERIRNNCFHEHYFHLRRDESVEKKRLNDAFHWHKKSAENCENCFVTMYFFHLYGFGTPRDLHEALKVLYISSKKNINFGLVFNDDRRFVVMYHACLKFNSILNLK